MQIAEHQIQLKGEDITLTNHRAIYWQKECALILSDLHIGKTAHFRKHGIPMPDAILQKDLMRLEVLIHHFKAETLLIVGDLFHAETNSDMIIFKNWLKQFGNLSLILVKGNHDRQSKTLMDELKIKVMPQLNLAPFLFIHEPNEKIAESFTISGHTHPGVLIKGKGKQKIKLPCYQISNMQLILPAFSLFTGLNTSLMPNDAINYAFTENEIFKL